VKALTLHQPWAPAIAEGIKTIETRSWSTSYRGPLAIHAGKSTEWEQVDIDGWTLHAIDADVPEVRRLGAVHNGELVPDRYERRLAFPAPLGAVVAVVNLVDVVPIGGPTSSSTGIFEGEEPATAGMDVVVHHPSLGDWAPELLVLDRWNGPTENIDHELPWGDFTPGRWAWLPDDIRKLDEPIPARGRQGLWEWDEAAAEALR
jgi:hypothetical protein